MERTSPRMRIASAWLACALGATAQVPSQVMYNQKMGDLQGQRDLFAINKIYSMGELTTRPQADILETVGPIPERIPGGVVWQVNGLLSAGVRPVVQDGAVLVATRDRVLHCLELATGAQRWVLKLKGDPAGQLVQGPGFALLGLEGGYLLCVDLKTGKARWTASLDGAKGGKTNDGEIQPVTQPVLMDDKVFVGTFTRGTFKTGGNLYALDAAKGTRLWERPLPGGATHPPVAAMGLVWSGGWEQLSAYQTADGAEAKVFPLKNGAVEILTRTPARLYLRCALDAYEVDLAGRSMKPVPALAGGSGLTTGGDLLVQGGESARVVDSGTWTEAWQSAEKPMGTPVVQNGLVFLAEAPKSLKVRVLADGKVLALTTLLADWGFPRPLVHGDRLVACEKLPNGYTLLEAFYGPAWKRLWQLTIPEAMNGLPVFLPEGMVLWTQSGCLRLLH